MNKNTKLEKIKTKSLSERKRDIPLIISDLKEYTDKQNLKATNTLHLINCLDFLSKPALSDAF